LTVAEYALEVSAAGKAVVVICNTAGAAEIVMLKLADAFCRTELESVA